MLTVKELRKRMGLCRRCGDPLNGDPRLQCEGCRAIQAAEDAARRKRRLAPIIDWKKNEHRTHGYRCPACRHPRRLMYMEIDHIVPKSKGGTDDPDNLQLLCRLCNRVKGDRDMDYLREKIERFPEIWRDPKIWTRKDCA